MGGGEGREWGTATELPIEPRRRPAATVGWKGVEGRRNGGGVEEARDGGTGSQWEGGREGRWGWRGPAAADSAPSSTCGGGGIEWEVGTAEQ